MRHVLLAVMGGLLISTSVSANTDAVLTLDRQSFTESQLEPWVQQSLYDIRREAWENTRLLLEQSALDLYVKKQAELQGKDKSTVKTALLAIKPVSDSDIQAFYDNYRDHIQAPLNEVRDAIREQLENVRQQQQLMSVLAKIREDSGLQVLISEPKAPVFNLPLDGYPVKGKQNALFTLVEFADYRCPYCKKGGEMVSRLMEAFPDSLKVSYVDFPVVDPASGISTAVIQGAWCAGAQDRYWDYHKLAYEQQGTLSKTSPNMIAAKLGLDSKAFNACMTSPESSAFVDQATVFGRHYGVSSTPTFFLNGQRLSGSDIESQIRERLGQSKVH